MYTMSQITHITDLSNCGDRISEISKMKISKVNSTVRLCGGIYSYMSGV